MAPSSPEASVSPLLSAAAKLAYVTGLVTMMAAGTVNMMTRTVVDAPLEGYEERLPAPSLGLATVRDETFQKAATAWFDQRWGLRGYAVRTDNSLVSSLFGESRTNNVVVGRDGTLISGEDTNYMNRSDPPDDAIALAKTIARIQGKLRARGKVMIPVLMPAKTSFFRDAVPSEARRRNVFGLADTNLYAAFVRTLEAEEVAFVDGRKLLAERRALDVFAPTGRHWRVSAACRVLQATLDVARPELPELGEDQIDCHTHVDPNASIEEEDYDLFRLQNTWRRKPAGVDVEVLDGAKGTPALKVPTLFVGSSFLYKFIQISRELEVLRPSLFYYYNASVVDTTTVRITKKVEPFTEEWRKDTFSKRLFIVGLLETYIPHENVRFFEEIERELERPSSLVPPG